MYCAGWRQAVSEVKGYEERIGGRMLNRNPPDWYGATLEEARRLAVDGDPRGADIRQRTASITRRMEHSIKGLRWRMSDEPGIEIDVPSAVSEDPCWVDWVDSKGAGAYRGKAAVVGVNGALQSGTAPEQFLWRGSAICSAIGALESVGYGVRVLWVFNVHNERSKADPNVDPIPVVEIKDPGEQLNYGRLAFWLCHAAALRRIGFALFHKQDPGLIERNYDGFGLCSDRPVVPLRLDAFLGGVFRLPETAGMAETLVREILKPFGILIG